MKGANKATEKVSRREILTAGAAAAAGVVAAAVLPGVAQAADDDPVVIGQENAGASPTVLTSATEGAALRVDNPQNEVFSLGVMASGFNAVWAESKGVKIGQPGPPPTGVLANYTAPESDAALGIALWGDVRTGESDPDTTPVWSEKGIGVLGLSGEAPDFSGGSPFEEFYPAKYWGVGVLGVGTRKGVLALSSAGKALEVQGKASFSRSGRATIYKGRTSRTVTGLSGLTTSSLILVTLQGSAGATTVVRYAARVNSTSFKVALNKAAANNVSFAWFILN